MAKLVTELRPELMKVAKQKKELLASRRLSFPTLMHRLVNQKEFIKDKNHEEYFEILRDDIEENKKIQTDRFLEPFALYMPQPVVFLMNDLGRKYMFVRDMLKCDQPQPPNDQPYQMVYQAYGD